MQRVDIFRNNSIRHLNLLAHKASFAGYNLAIILSNIILVAFYREHVSLGVFILAILGMNLCCLTFGAAVNATLLLHFNDKKWHAVNDFKIQVRGVESGTPPRRSWVIQGQVEKELDYPVRTVKNNTPSRGANNAYPIYRYG